MRSGTGALLFIAVFPSFLLSDSIAQAPLPEPSPRSLPRWRGFNLLEKFQLDSRAPFKEDDFRMISELGFNFVRLPMDYRIWIKDGDWRRFDESQLKEIDQAVEWGKKYGVHVCVNFHRAPGYTVATPPERKSIWTDPEALEVCALHWAEFAKRYKGVPKRNLSFNLMNEPHGVDGTVYFKVVKRLVEAIRAHDPERLIIADGLEWGSSPCRELLPLGVAQATRGYVPFGLTHYKARWIGGSKSWPKPQWPANSVSCHLYGPEKRDLKTPLSIEFSKPLDRPVKVSIEIGTVSELSAPALYADGREIWRRRLKCGPGKGEWAKSVYVSQWRIYQNVYERLYECGEIPSGAASAAFSNEEGDWLSFNRILLEWRGAGGSPVQAEILPGCLEWGCRQEGAIKFDLSASPFFKFPGSNGGEWLWRTCVQPWKDFEAEGSGVMVGEFGAYDRTPHNVVMPWMKDCLENWRKAGWGWALWNFRGSFGVMDSGRDDVQYEDFEGHKLDREMLSLLQSY